MSDTSQEHGWDRGWDDHDRRQLCRLASLPLTEKLRWLEEAHRLVRHLSGATERPAAGKVSR